MALKTKLAAAGLAALTLAATTAGAFAATAYVTSNVNVRAGAGTYYGVVDTLMRGERVDVQYCQDSWCFVQKSGPDGWVSANYLDRGRPAYNPPPRWNDDNDWNYGPRPGWNRPPRPVYPLYPAYPAYPSYPHRPHFQGNYNNGGSSVCVNGPNGYFCLGD